jgi:hypothetical protein
MNLKGKLKSKEEGGKQDWVQKNSPRHNQTRKRGKEMARSHIFIGSRGYFSISSDWYMTSHMMR